MIAVVTLMPGPMNTFCQILCESPRDGTGHLILVDVVSLGLDRVLSMANLDPLVCARKLDCNLGSRHVEGQKVNEVLRTIKKIEDLVSWST